MKVKRIIITSDLESLRTSGRNNGNTDVVIVLESGKKFIASFFSYDYLNSINYEHVKNGEYLNGNYFWNKSMVLVKGCTKDIIEPVVYDLIEEGNFQEAFMEL